MLDRQYEERQLVRLQRTILHSRKWLTLIKRINDGVPAREEKIEIAHVAEIFGTAPLATAMRDGIVFNADFFRLVGRNLKRRLLAHEMLHMYMARNQLSGWCDRDDEFLTYAHYLGCDVEIMIKLDWRTLGDKRWRRD